jgi:uncharacterized protein (TIGR01777 family)
MNRVLISGASGLIGAAFTAPIEAQGVQVVRLVRGRSQNSGEISWNPADGTALDPSEVSGFDAVVHLAGETIAGRWTEGKKKAIRDSRLLGTRNLASALARTGSKPMVFICASAIGFYGDRGEEVLTEESPRGRGFLADLCRDWEEATGSAAEAGIRTVNLRTGLVLSAKGGALGKMLLPFKLGLGGRIGPGRQWWSWVQIDDMVGGIQHAIDTASLTGPVNMVAPNAARNAEFTKVLASVLGRPAVFPVPEFALGLAFGKMAADELFLASQHVLPAKLTASGYRFQYEGLRGALESLV